jgi:NADP-dependent 3-hydroxy acid dehydrogenase YdfG
MDLDNAVCIVTGASSGIGATTARLLASRGARVVLAARRIDRLESLAKELPGSIAVQTDVTVADQVERLMERTQNAFGTADVVVNNAGQGLHVPLEQLKADDLRAVFELNVVAPLVVMQSALPMLRSGNGGAIVNVSSLTSLRAFPGLGGYAATKSALNMISGIARLEWADSGITVSSVYPSVTATEFHDRLRAGHLVTGPWSTVPDPPELVATAILFAVQHGDEHVLVADPPRAIHLGAEAEGVLRVGRGTK